MKPLKLRPLLPSRAEALAAACKRNDHEPALRELGQDLRKLLKPSAKAHRRPKLPRTPRPKPASGTWGTQALRWAVWERSGGRCECGCKRRITWAGPLKFDLDHALGKARAGQTPENCWALAGDCHRDKHAAKPSRDFWLRRFLLHLEQHGFGASPTAAGIRDELAAEEKLQEAQRHAARAVSGTEDLAERARRAEGAADASP